MFEAILVVVISYLFGSIPSGLLLSKTLGYGDIRNKGSGNIGATNALRVGGKKLGVTTLVMDCIKGIIPILLFKSFNLGNDMLALAGFFVVVGHIFPIWLKFKGGKGVATTVAVFLTLTPYVGFVFMLVWVSLFLLKRIVSVASLTAMFVATLAALWFSSTPYFVMTTGLFFLIFYRHHDNIKRLIQGKEYTF